ncbi:MAG: PHP domain-containing protein [Planctomycetes bacterium]|nr:PHP domain-containing protein [Planctomycetota bacterium]MBL7144914.1 PHP domain-containing protein [Phycisphaerae bacterium]
MRKVRADLHLHTCLSPCADNQMQPAAIIERSKKAGLDMIGICDHNSGENVRAMMKAGERQGIAIIPGVEVTSREEVHILGLFDTEQDLMRLQDIIYENLPGQNDEEAFGPQLIIDEYGNVVGQNSRLLIGATTLTLEQIIDAIHQFAGLAVASHIDRQRFSLIGQLGFIPKGLKLDAVEVSIPSSVRQEYDYPVVTSSDAHFLEDIGKNSTCFMIEDTSLQEISKALRCELGRMVVSN